MLVDDPNFAAPLAPTGTLSAPPPAFVWTGGGRRLTPEEVAQQRAEAQRMEAAGMDFSPVQSWAQGAARVMQGLVGSIEARRAAKSADANAQQSQSVVQSLLSSNDPATEQSTVLNALANPYIDEKTRSLVGAEYAKLNPAPGEPHFFEANNGDQGAIDPTTGQVKIVYHDPTPKVSFTAVDNGDGTKTLVPVVNGQVMWGGSASGKPPATLPPDFDFGNGGPGGSPSGAGFPQ